MILNIFKYPVFPSEEVITFNDEMVVAFWHGNIDIQPLSPDFFFAPLWVQWAGILAVAAILGCIGVMI